MSKVITFSEKFPSYHPRSGAETNFVKKVLTSLGIDPMDETYFILLCELNRKNLFEKKLTKFDLLQWVHKVKMSKPEAPKLHTIRGAGRFKAGEFASLRVWFGAPRKSPQIIFWKDIQIQSVLPFEMEDSKANISGYHYANLTDTKEMMILAQNDGLTVPELLHWFKYPEPAKDLEIICWGDVTYNPKSL